MSENLPSLPTPEEQVEVASKVIKARSKREREFFDRAELLEIICSHVADGGSLITLCKRWHIRYGRVMQWVNKEKSRQEQVEAAYLSRKEWAIQTILDELRAIATFDITHILDSAGRVRPPSEWPEGYGRLVESIEIKELASRDGEQLFGEMKKIKFHSKMRALELLGKAEAMFIEKHEHTFKPVTLGELLDASWNSETKDVTDTAK